jgi:hypothetical protein
MPGADVSGARGSEQQCLPRHDPNRDAENPDAPRADSRRLAAAQIEDPVPNIVNEPEKLTAA